MENVAAGRYWYVSDAFKDGSLLDPPELQAKKAAVILAELERVISELPDPETLPDSHMGEGSKVDAQAKIMMVWLNADSQLRQAIRKPAPAAAPAPQIQSFEPL